jgi:hypothetical protein
MFSPLSPYVRGESPETPPPPSPAELLERLESLKKEVARLEQTLKTLPARSPSSPTEASPEPLPASAAVAADPTLADPEPPSGSDKKLPPVLNFLSSVDFSGMVDGYYQYNVNQPQDRTVGLRAFDGPANQMTLGLAELALSKAPTRDSPLGFALSFDFGETINVVNAAEPVGGLGFAQYLKEAYFSYQMHEKFQVDFGKWVTPIGAEVIESKNNWNYSRGLLYTWAIPLYHYGLRAQYTINDTAWVTAHLANGWNNVVENNSGKSFAIQVGFSPVPELSVVQNYMVGPELTGSNDSIRHVWDTIVTYNHDDNLSFLVNYDYGRETGAFPTDPDQAWQGIAGYVRYAFNDKVAVASRLEWFQDDDGWSTGTQQQVKEFTQTFEYKLAGDLLSRFEVRRDWSTAPVFLKGANRFVQNQTTFLLGFVYSFDAGE